MNAMLHMWHIYRSISFISLQWSKYKEVVKLQKSVTTLGKTFPEVLIKKIYASDILFLEFQFGKK